MIPGAWLARFGRTAADQVLEAVDARLKAPRRPGLEGRIAGIRLDGAPRDRRSATDGLPAGGGSGRRLDGPGAGPVESMGTHSRGFGHGSRRVAT